MKSVGVLLSGCGYQDGSEVQEAVCTLLALDQLNVRSVCLSIGGKQRQVTSHLSGKNQSEHRQILDESARIARGEVQLLNQSNISDLDALVIPGGFGCALNLSDFALHGNATTVNQEVHDAIVSFFSKKKPIGAICIAPVLVAKVLGQHGIKLTIGSDKQIAQILSTWGAKIVDCGKRACVVDEANRIVSTPAYMYGDSNVNDVYKGIYELVHNIVKFVKT